MIEILKRHSRNMVEVERTGAPGADVRSLRRLRLPFRPSNGYREGVDPLSKVQGLGPLIAVLDKPPLHTCSTKAVLPGSRRLGPWV
jgi:hypothetical protein